MPLTPEEELELLQLLEAELQAGSQPLLFICQRPAETVLDAVLRHRVPADTDDLGRLVIRRRFGPVPDPDCPCQRDPGTGPLYRVGLRHDRSAL